MTEPGFLTTTRSSYDALAEDYDARFRDELAAKHLERAMLTAFADHVRADGGGPVADIGCGTGHATGYLHSLGLDVFGIDLSPGMLAVARRTHPGVRFAQGSMTDLDLAGDSLAGLVAFYSIIHIPPGELPGVFAAFHRVLAPGGRLLLTFQTGAELLHFDEALGQAVSLDFHRPDPDHVERLLAEAGLTVHARVVRDAEAGERSRQAHLLARKPVE